MECSSKCDKCSKQKEHLIKTAVQIDDRTWEVKLLSQECYDEYQEYMKTLREKKGIKPL